MQCLRHTYIRVLLDCPVLFECLDGCGNVRALVQLCAELVHRHHRLRAHRGKSRWGILAQSRLNWDSVSTEAGKVTTGGSMLNLGQSRERVGFEQSYASQWTARISNGARGGHSASPQACTHTYWHASQTCPRALARDQALLQPPDALDAHPVRAEKKQPGSVRGPKSEREFPSRYVQHERFHPFACLHMLFSPFLTHLPMVRMGSVDR